MKLSLRQCQAFLVCSYVLFNLVAYVSAMETGVLSGDFAEARAPSLEAATMLLLADALSYGVVLFPVFEGLRRFGRTRSRRGEERDRPLPQPTKIHGLVTALLLFQLIFAMSTGVGVAGTFAKTDSPLRFIIYIIPIDMVALIYLAAADNTRIYRINLLAYFSSSLARGWSFGIVFLLVIAVIRNGGIRITWTRALGWGAFLGITTPIILLLRFVVRDGAGDSASLSDLLDFMNLVLDGQNIYLYIVGFVADRLQHFTSVAYIYDNRDAISAALASGEFRHFFLDGAFYPPLAELFGYKAPLELNSWLTAHYHGLDIDAVAYNTHVGLIGWPILAPELLPIYLCFVGTLGAASVFVSRGVGGKFVVELTWLMWLLLLMNGWFGAFISYLVALIIFRATQLMVGRAGAGVRTRAAAGPATTGSRRLEPTGQSS